MKLLALSLSCAVFVSVSTPITGQVCSGTPLVEVIGTGTPGSHSAVPKLSTRGAPIEGFPFDLLLRMARPNAKGILIVGTSVAPSVLPAFGATIYPGGHLLTVPLKIDASGAATILVKNPVGSDFCGLEVVVQAAIRDKDAQGGIAFSGAMHLSFGPASAGAPVLGSVVSPTSTSAVTLSGTGVQADNTIRITGPATIETKLDASRFFSVTVPLHADATNTLFVQEIFPGGIVGPPNSLTVIQDSSPPALAIEFPPDGSVLSTSTTNVAGTISDKLSGFMGLSVTVNGQPATVNVGVGTNGSFDLPALDLGTGGPVAITVNAQDAVGNTAMATSTVVFQPPLGASLTIVAGADQTGVVGADLAEQLVVRAKTTSGSPITGKPVTFEVIKSDGRLDTASGGPGAMKLTVLTDMQGDAKTSWRLGSDAGMGNNRVRATWDLSASAVFFNASATPNPTSLKINVGSGNNQAVQAGTAAPELLNAWVNDGQNGVAGVPVSFDVTQGSGLLESEAGGLRSGSLVVPTDLTGHARVRFVAADQAEVASVSAGISVGAGLPAVFTLRTVKPDLLGTRLSGVVRDNSVQPLGGATVRLRFTSGEEESTITDQSGRFEFQALDMSGPAVVIVEGATATLVGGDAIDPAALTFPELARDVFVIAQAANDLQRPILLPRLDPASIVMFDGTKDIQLTMASVEGLVVWVPKGTTVHKHDGSLVGPMNPIGLSISPVHVDDIPMPLPDGASAPLAWTFQPGGSTFDPPLPIQLPNMAGLPAGAGAYILVFDHDTGRFEIVAPAAVSSDGSFITSSPGTGISEAGWGGFCPPYPNTGITMEDPFKLAKDKLVQDYLDKAASGSSFTALAHQIKCLAETACGIGPLTSSKPKWAQKSPIPEMLEDLADNLDNPVPPIGLLSPLFPMTSLGCSVLPGWVGVPGVLTANDVCSVLSGLGRHFPFELIPGFARYSAQLKPGSPGQMCHKDFLDNTVAPCFGTVPEFSPPVGAAGALVVPFLANWARDITVSVTCFWTDFLLSNAVFATNPIAFPQLPPPPDSSSLYSPMLAQLGSLSVRTRTDEFFLEVGASYQLQVMKDGFDLTQSSAGTVYVVAQVQGDFVAADATIDEQGGISILSTLSPLRSIPTLLYVVAQNGDDVGVGQFAVLGIDSDGDLIVDSFELKVGTDPLVAGTPFDDADGDSLPDLIEALHGTYATVADTDGDVVSDFAEYIQGSDATNSVSVDPRVTEDWTITVNGQVTKTQAGGAYSLSNIPTTPATRVHWFGERLGKQFFARSSYFPISNGSTIEVGPAQFADEPFAETVTIQAALSTVTLTSIGQIEQIETIANYSDGSSATVAGFADGVAYQSSSTQILSVDADGLVTAQSTGKALVTVTKDGAASTVKIVVAPGDPLTAVRGMIVDASMQAVVGAAVTTTAGFATASSAGGAFEIANHTTNKSVVRVDATLSNGGTKFFGFSLDNTVVPGGVTEVGIIVIDADSDGDQLPDWYEINLFGTSPQLSDTDGDVLNDGAEVFVFGTNPGLTDSDGDGFDDNVEVSLGSSPLGFDLGTTLSGLVELPGGVPAAGATVTVFGVPATQYMATADASGFFSFGSPWPASLSPVVLRATLVVQGQGAFAGLSEPTPTVPGGQTFVGTIALFDGTGGGSLYPAALNFAAGFFPVSVAIGDLDQDGVPDLAVANYESFNVSVLLGQGDGTFAAALNFAASTPVSVAIGDLDQDDVPDLAVANESSNYVSVLLGQGDGTFAAALNFAAGSIPRSVAIGDLDQDGVRDLAVANLFSNNVSVLLGHGDGTFAAALNFAAGSRPFSVAIGDLDQDGVPDLAVANTNSNNVSVLLGQGDGTFAAALSFAAGSGPSSVAIGDLDQDGVPDLAVTVSSKVSVLLGQGDGTFAAALNFAAGSTPYSVAIGDLDQDGVRDFAVANENSNNVSVLLGQGDGTFAAALSFAAGTGPFSVAIGDLDQDGVPDLAVANSNSNNVSVLLHQ